MNIDERIDQVKDIYFQKLLRQFRTAFLEHRNSRIVLYSLGAFSATVVEVLRDFHFVGLMDRDPENVGKNFFGLPVFSPEQAEQQADLIVINTEESYWQTIYRRIAHLNIPVYYRNGTRAQLEQRPNTECAYWSRSGEELAKLIDQYEVISFDIFDTLLMRRVLEPQDVFRLVEYTLRIDFGLELPFTKLRLQALHEAGQTAELDDIYLAFRRISGLGAAQVERIKLKELEIERRVLIPRRPVAALFRRAAAAGKEIFVLSDMYLPGGFVRERLAECGITGDYTLWISAEQKAEKRDGSMWAAYAKAIRGKKALHIGDDPVCDEEKPRAAGIDTYRIFSAAAMLKHSSLQDLFAHVLTLNDALIAGLIAARLFEDPFALHGSKGRVCFHRFEDLGYSAYGCVLYTFLVWLLGQICGKGFDMLLFFARDGYFMAGLYELLAKRLSCGQAPNGIYFMISRRLAAIAAIENEEDLLEVVRLPYNGTFAQYMHVRFGIEVPASDQNRERVVNPGSDFEALWSCLTPYMDRLRVQIRMERANYRAYCRRMLDGKKFAIVDTWYNGSCQYYLSKLLDRSMTGYYFLADPSQENRNASRGGMISCFADLPGGCGINRRSLQFESVYTAPHGMVKSCDENGAFSFESPGGNQARFTDKERINNGVRMFMEDMLSLLGCERLEDALLSCACSDWIYESIFSGSCDFSQEIRSSYVNENVLTNADEFPIMD